MEMDRGPTGTPTPADPTAVDRIVTVRARRMRPGRDLAHLISGKLHRTTPEEVRRWIEEGRVKTGAGEVVRPGDAPRPGVSYVVFVPPPRHRRPHPLPLEILYEDPDILAINKPPGIPVHPSMGHMEATIFNALLARYGAGTVIRFPRRLDIDTSGVLLATHNRLVGRELFRIFQGRLVEKIYVALVQGAGPEEGLIDAPLGRDPEDPHRAIVVPSGRPSRTRVRTLRRFDRSGYALVEANAETGRTHQVRVHLSWKGSPIVGDPIYHPEPGVAERDGLPIRRTALHASEIAFPHPMTGAEIRITAPMPPDLTETIAILDARERGCAGPPNGGSEPA